MRSRGGPCCLGNARSPKIFAQASALERSLQSRLSVRAQHGGQQLRVISPHSIGVELDATGCPRRWEGSLYPIGQLPGLTEDLQAVDDACKTAIIDRELPRLNIDIAALQETQLPESGKLHFLLAGKE